MANIDATSGLILKRSSGVGSYDVYLDGRIVGGIDEITTHFGIDAPCALVLGLPMGRTSR